MIFIYSSLSSIDAYNQKKNSIILLVFLIINLVALVIPSVLVKGALGSAFLITEGWLTRIQKIQTVFTGCSDETLDISDTIIEAESVHSIAIGNMEGTAGIMLVIVLVHIAPIALSLGICKKNDEEKTETQEPE